MPLNLLQSYGGEFLQHNGSIVARGGCAAATGSWWLEAGCGGAGFECGSGGQMRSCTCGCSRMLEYAKVERLLVRLYAPRYGVSSRDIDPADEVRLWQRISKGGREKGSMVLALLCTSMFSIPAMAAGLQWLCAYRTTEVGWAGLGCSRQLNFLTRQDRSCGRLTKNVGSAILSARGWFSRRTCQARQQMYGRTCRKGRGPWRW